ncbi:hypothetical protein K0O23_18675 [Pontibacter aydingkolensis]|uniref:Uncharacterized protein n=2 Tax=Pontibacter aydingkolensis TaxID=1911536 RepID=A0ABS7CZ52_9BACT|nr:hypothetical protein [Pontibacter aydingkolensis]
MLIIPAFVRSTLRKAGSTALINYGELSLRMIPAIAFILYAEHSIHPPSFKIIGWYIVLTSIVLMIIPRKFHHRLSNRFADFLTPRMFTLISPFAVMIGGFLLYIIL